MNNTALFIIVIVIFAILALFVIPRFRMKRAVDQVVWIFREQNATSAKTAKTVDELGLKPRTFMEGMFRGRDYKPYALDLLRRGEIVQMTEDGRLYLSEDQLDFSGLHRR